MRGDLWRPHGAATTPITGWVEVSADVLADAPTVVVVPVTTVTPCAGLGWPVVLGMGSTPWMEPAWIVVTQVHTILRGELGTRVGALTDAQLHTLNDALTRVLGGET